MTRGLHISSAELAVQTADLVALERFYLQRLGLSAKSVHRDRMELAVGAGDLCFTGVSGERTRPFYHFALLVPGNRFDAARDWLAGATSLLSPPNSDQTTFEFDSWNARACYGHDPAGNIVELIAHLGLEHSEQTGPFEAIELRGVSEVGLVISDPSAAVRALRSAGLALWSGNVDSAGLGFVGRQAHTLILCAPQRPWLPTGRPAELFPVVVRVVIPGGSTVTVCVSGGSLTAVG